MVFYASGHAGLEASYLYALLARLYGNNNLPQSSNMCHETTSVGLTKVIGSPVGTIVWDDLANTDAFFFFGQNPGTNSPRFLHPLQDAKKRGAKVVTFNPIREQGLVSFVNPQNMLDMMTGNETQISDQYLQLKSGGDVAAIMGLCKVVIEADDRPRPQARRAFSIPRSSRSTRPGLMSFATVRRRRDLGRYRRQKRTDGAACAPRPTSISQPNASSASTAWA